MARHGIVAITRDMFCFIFLTSSQLYLSLKYSTEQYNTVQYSTVQYSTVQYSTVHQTCNCCIEKSVDMVGGIYFSYLSSISESVAYVTLRTGYMKVTVYCKGQFLVRFTFNTILY